MWKTLENLFSPRRHPFDGEESGAQTARALMWRIQERETRVDCL